MGHTNEEGISLRKEDSGASARCSRDLSYTVILVRVGLLNDIDLPGTANCINAVTLGSTIYG